MLAIINNNLVNGKNRPPDISKRERDQRSSTKNQNGDFDDRNNNNFFDNEYPKTTTSHSSVIHPGPSVVYSNIGPPIGAIMNPNRASTLPQNVPSGASQTGPSVLNNGPPVKWRAKRKKSGEKANSKNRNSSSSVHSNTSLEDLTRRSRELAHSTIDLLDELIAGTKQLTYTTK